MRHASSRHATRDENSDAIGISDTPGSALVPRGVASDPAPMIPQQVSPYAASYPAQTIATRPAYSVASPYPALPDHVADQLTPGLADRTGWALFQWMQDRHLFPALAVIAGDACGWGAAATEPMHPWFGSVFLGVGIVNGLAYTAVNLVRAINGDGEPMSVGAHIIGIAGGALTAFGTACITGVSFLSAGVTLIPAGAGYYAWFQNRQSRVREQRQFVVDYTAASTPALVPMPGGSGLNAAPQVIAGQVLSHEERQVRRAFEGDGVHKGLGIALTDVHSFSRIDGDSWSITVVLAPNPNVSPESVIARRDVLCSALGANQVIAVPLRRGNELRLTVRYGEIDPLAEDNPFPGPVATSITQPVPLGTAADGSKGEILLWGIHSLVGGATGGGKSVCVKTLVISLAAMTDAVVWLIDLKPGRIELGIFEPIADRSARDISDAALMLEALTAVAKARGDMLAEIRERTGTPVEKWDPAEHGPVLVVVLDELAELVRQSKKVRKNAYPPRVMEAIKFIASNFETAVQVYRALGIQIVMATQSPDSSITSGDGKGGIDQIQNLVCFQTSKVSQTNIILGPGAHGDGYRAHTDLYVPGMFYMRTPAVKIPVKYKAYYVGNDEIVEYVERYAESRPALDARSAEAAASVLGDVGSTPRTGPPSGGGGIAAEVADEAPAGATVRHLRSVPLYPDGAEIDEKHRALWDLLDTFSQGATVSELAGAALAAGHENCSLAWVRDVCKRWRTAGVVGVGIEGRDYRYWRDDEAVKLRLRREA